MPTPAGTAAVNAEGGYIWFALRDSELLPSTLLWREHNGRHRAPWNGSNCALGLEDACTFFDYGMRRSSEPNDFSSQGIRTHHQLSGAAFRVPYVQGFAICQANFGRVATMTFHTGLVHLHDDAGHTASARVDWTYALTGHLTSTATPTGAKASACASA